jgi:hypothetical protein
MPELPDGLGILDPTLLQNYSFDNYTPPRSIPVWEARPLHYPPTCRQDQILLNLVEARKQFKQIKAKDFELSDDKFPAVAPLLNPQHHEATYPLTASIASVSHRSPLLSLTLTSILIEYHPLFYLT